jgi:hypothetical protein
MKRDDRALSVVRESSPFATPPRVLVVADEESAGEAASLVDALEALGADAEVRFGASNFDLSHSDAVLVAETRGYRVTRHHPILENLKRAGKL